MIFKFSTILTETQQADYRIYRKERKDNKSQDTSEEQGVGRGWEILYQILRLTITNGNQDSMILVQEQTNSPKEE